MLSRALTTPPVRVAAQPHDFGGCVVALPHDFGGCVVALPHDVLRL